jgi:hypothetical protein
MEATYLLLRYILRLVIPTYWINFKLLLKLNRVQIEPMHYTKFDAQLP